MNFYLLVLLYLMFFVVLTWRNFNLALALLFFLLPSYLIRFHIGPLPTTLLETTIGLITIAWLIRYRLDIRHRIANSIKGNWSLFTAIALFLLAATVSIFTSINTRAALGEWKAFYIEPIILFLVIITTAKNNDHKTKRQEDHEKAKSFNLSIFQSSPANQIISALTISALSTSLLAIFQHSTGWMVPHAFWTNHDTYRVTAWYGFPNAVGMFLAPIIPLTIYLITQMWQIIAYRGSQVIDHKNRPLITNYLLLITSLASIPTSLFAIYFAKSIGALVALVAGLLFFLFFYNKKTRVIACLAGLACVIGLVGLRTSDPIKQELFLQDRSGQLRVNMWAETVEFLKAHPIAGAGLASYSKLIYPYRVDKWIEVFHHPHNLFLTMWVNLGLLGLFAFVWIIVAIFKQFNNFSIFNLCILSSLIIILVMGLVDSPYIKNDLSILFWLLPALLLTKKYGKLENK